MRAAGLMDFLRDHYGDGRLGEDILWNKTNHRLLDEEDLRILAEEYGVRPWRFWQKEVRLCSYNPSATGTDSLVVKLVNRRSLAFGVHRLGSSGMARGVEKGL